MSTELVKDVAVSVADHQVAYMHAGHGPALTLLHDIPTNRYPWRDILWSK